MRTNIVLDDDLVAEAFSYAESIHTKRALIEEALREFIRTRKMKDLRELKDKIRFSDGYDHKQMRAGQ
jgi:Arc/MetJ family transcription regulator